MEGDEDLLHRVVSNLVWTAVQAAGKEARVTVRTGRPEPHQLPGGAGIDNPVALAVNDNGPGIPENVRARLFEPFVTGRVGGTGLGLAIVQRAVDAHRGLVLVDSTKDQDPETAVILMTAQASLQTAIQAVNQGAFHYVPKPFSNDEIVALCRRAAEVRRLKAENKQLKQEIRRRERSGLVKPLGKSRLFQDVLRLAEQVAPTESTVLIQGESGTGKEVIARYIHERSARTEGPFLSLNCGALPESLLESELFGHVKGSFTGAVRDKQGLF